MLTGERFLTSMNQSMGLKMSFGDEALPTALKVALEWSITSMRSHMGLKITSLAKKFHAIGETAKQDLIGGTLTSQNLVISLAQRNGLMVKGLFAFRLLLFYVYIGRHIPILEKVIDVDHQVVLSFFEIGNFLHEV